MIRNRVWCKSKIDTVGETNDKREKYSRRYMGMADIPLNSMYCHALEASRIVISYILLLHFQFYLTRFLKHCKQSHSCSERSQLQER